MFWHLCCFFSLLRIVLHHTVHLHICLEVVFFFLSRRLISFLSLCMVWHYTCPLHACLWFVFFYLSPCMVWLRTCTLCMFGAFFFLYVSACFFFFSVHTCWQLQSLLFSFLLSFGSSLLFNMMTSYCWFYLLWWFIYSLCIYSLYKIFTCV